MTSIQSNLFMVDQKNKQQNYNTNLNLTAMHFVL